MKKFKILTLLLSTVMLSGMIIPQNVHAQTMDPQTYSINDFNADLVEEDNLNLIQEKYLNQHSDGTFYISDDAYKTIDSDILTIAKKNMDSINSHILNGDLEFEIIKNNNSTEVINTVDNLSYKLKNAIQLYSTGHFYNYTYCSNFNFSWYGFTADMNAAGTKLLKNYLVLSSGTTAATATIASLVPGGQALAVALGVFTMTISTGIYQCENGIDTGKGVTIKAFGAPEDATTYSINARY